MARKHIDPTDISESLNEVIRAAMGDDLPMAFYATFSGDTTNDVKFVDDIVYVRYTWLVNDDTREGWGQLQQTEGGYWFPPAGQETRVYVQSPPDVKIQGGALVSWAAGRNVKATGKLGPTQNMKVSSDTQMNALRGQGWMFRAANGLTFGIGKSGQFQVNFTASGSGFRFDPDSNTIDIVICVAGENAPRAQIHLDQNGVTFGASNGLGTVAAPLAKKAVLWSLTGSDGGAVLTGSGPFSALHPSGFLGVKATAGGVPVAGFQSAAVLAIGTTGSVVDSLGKSCTGTVPVTGTAAVLGASSWYVSLV